MGQQRGERARPKRRESARGRHMGREQFRCRYCGARFDDEEAARSHAAAEHSRRPTGRARRRSRRLST